MSPSSDIETLFGHFGGNAGDYQEIGRENEASSARTRWPLLVTLDLMQPSIPAIAQRSDPLAKQSDESARAQAPQDDAPATKSPAEVAAAREAGTPLTRSKTPLFARPHRRSVPPVVSPVNADGPRGAARFSPLPAALEDRLAASEAAPAAAAVAGVPPAVAPSMTRGAAVPPPVAPAAAPVVVTPRATATVPPVAAAAPLSFRAPAFAPAPAPVRAPAPAAAPAPSAAPPAESAFATRFGTAAAAPAQPRTAFAAAWAAAPAAAAPPASQPPSILGKLFAPAARSAPASAQASVGEAPPASLNSVFDRLRGAAKAPATPAATPHSWLTNGPRRS